jgi:tRNA(fMet)-specific endonuclease VapC
MRHVLDTTAFSAVMKRETDMETFLKRVKPEDVATVPPVVAEIEYGIQRLQEGTKRKSLLLREKGRILSALDVLPWEPDSSRLFGTIKADLERRGEVLDDFDIAVAAIAKSHGCGVLTANLRHFQRIPDLHCSYWR